MKKIFSFAMGLLAMTTLQAANTEVARLTLTGQGGTESSNVTLRVDPAVSTAQTTSFFGATDEIGQVNIYAIEGTNTYSAYKKDNLSKLELQIITNRRDAADQHYTLTFNVPTLTDGLTLFDRATGTATPITHNGTYEFDVNTTLHPDFVAGTNYTVKERFYINYVAPAYVIMKGDFANPGGDWDYSTGNFTDNGATFTKELDLAADTWYNFQLEEGYSPAIIAADGSEFNRTNNSHNLPVDGWHSALSLHTDVAGTYTFTWNDVTDNLTITFPAPALSVTTNAYGFLSFASSEDVEFLGGLKAYKGIFNAGTFELTLVEIGTKVPAGEGVILWNSNETAETFYYNTGVDASAADVTGNDFVGAVAATPVSGISADAIYCLHGNELMKYVGTDDIPAGKAYLPVTVGGANPAPKHITMRFSETQAINNVEAEVKAEKFVQDGEIFIRRGNEVFNLQGQKVNF